MKPLRWLFFMLMLTSLLAGLATGLRLLFLIFTMCLILIILSLLYCLFAAMSFAYSQKVSKPTVVRGDTIHFSLSLYNEMALPYPLMTIRLNTTDPLSQERYFFNLEAHTQKTFDRTLTCLHRGQYLVGMTVIDFSDPFGLLTIPFDMRLRLYYKMLDLRVLPRILDFSRLPLQSLIGSLNLAEQSRASEDLFEPYSNVRDFRPGDPLKRIHWPASIRQRKLMSRQFEQYDEPRLSIWIDQGMPMGSPRQGLEDIDVVCETVASLSARLLSEHKTLDLSGSSPDRPTMAASGPRDMAKIQHWLADLNFQDSCQASVWLDDTISNANQQKILILVTHREDPDLLSSLRKADNGPIRVFLVFCGSPARNKAYLSSFWHSGLAIWTISGDGETGA